MRIGAVVRVATTCAVRGVFLDAAAFDTAAESSATATAAEFSMPSQLLLIAERCESTAPDAGVFDGSAMAIGRSAIDFRGALVGGWRHSDRGVALAALGAAADEKRDRKRWCCSRRS